MHWFQHDSNASLDSKLKKVRMRFGMTGYGFYWYLLELICSDITEHNITFELEHDSEVLAFDLSLNIDHVQEMMKYMVELGLFENKNGTITCLKMLKRLNQSMTSNPRLRTLIADAKANNSSDHDDVMTDHDEVMLHTNIHTNIQGGSTPKLDEVKAHVADKLGFPDDARAESLFHYYDSQGWRKANGVRIANWKSAISGCLARDKKNSKPSTLEIVK